MALKMFKSCLPAAAVLFAATNLALVAVAQQNSATSGSTLALIPGGQRAAGALALGADGLAQYFAANGPIQPAITAIGGLPLRGAELVNGAINWASNGLDRSAASLSRAAGSASQIRMPTLDALPGAVPALFEPLAEGTKNAIRGKNSFIMSQASSAQQAAQRLMQAHQPMQQQQVQSRRKRSVNPMEMMGHMTKSTMDNGKQVVEQIKEHFQGTMGRMQGMQDIGMKVMSQAQGLKRTLSSGLQGSMGHMQQTGEKMMMQMRQNHQQNTKAMGSMLGSMHGSMGKMGSNMQKNLDGVVRQAQQAAQQVTQSLQQAIKGPIDMLSNLGNSLNKGAMGGGSSGGGRY